MISLDLFMVVLLLSLIYYQYRRRGILLTPSVAALVAGVFLMVYVAYPFATDPQSLRTIGLAGYSSRVQVVVDEILLIVTVGTCSALLTYLLIPAWHRFRRIPVKPEKHTQLTLQSLTLGACACSLIGVAFVWLFFFIVGKVPMLAHDPDFVRNEIIATHPARYIYIGGYTVAGFGFVFLLPGLALKKITLYRPFAWVVVALVAYTNFLTGTRSNFLSPIVFAGLIYFSIGRFRLTVPRALVGLAAVLATASVFAILRESASMTLGLLFDEIVHGNTLLANLRDSGWVLLGFRVHSYDYFWGKTLLAQLLGFIPRGLLPFREEYSWGVITLEIIGMKSILHLGLGHVWFFDWYLNFGYPGVVCEGIFMGWVYRRLDTRLLAFVASAKKTNTYDYFNLFKIWAAAIAVGCLFTSSSILLIYPYLLGFLSIYAFALIAQKITGRFALTSAHEEGRRLATMRFRA